MMSERLYLKKKRKRNAHFFCFLRAQNEEDSFWHSNFNGNFKQKIVFFFFSDLMDVTGRPNAQNGSTSTILHYNELRRPLQLCTFANHRQTFDLQWKSKNYFLDCLVVSKWQCRFRDDLRTFQSEGTIIDFNNLLWLPFRDAGKLECCHLLWQNAEIISRGR